MGKGLLRKSVGAVVLMAVAASPVIAASAADIVKQRQAGFKGIGAAFKSINDELKGSTPQPSVLLPAAQKIDSAGHAQHGWFPRGSGAGVGIDTRALPAIWSDAAGFKAAQDLFATRAITLLRATKGRDIEAVRAAAKQLGQSCGGCHRQFRSES